MYESLYADIISRWTEEIHNIKVNIIQLTEWIENEASHEFKELCTKRQRALVENLNELGKPLKNERNILGKIQHPKAFHETVMNRQTNINNYSNADTYSRQEPRDLLTVKLNRTMKLRKAENQRRQKANEGDLVNLQTKRGRQKLDEYKLKYVYDRLHETPTFASSCQRKARKSARGERLFQQHSITTVKTLPLSRTQTPVKLSNGRFGSGRPEKTSGDIHSAVKQSFLPPIRNKVALVAQGCIQNKVENEKMNTTLPSRLPRPLPRKKKKKAERLNDKATDSVGFTTTDVSQGENSSDSLLYGEPQKSLSSGSEGKKKTGNYHWKKLLKTFAPRENIKNGMVKPDDFKDIKSSFIDAQKIYGNPKFKVKSKKRQKQDTTKSEKLEKQNVSDQSINKKSKRHKSKRTTKNANHNSSVAATKCTSDKMGEDSLENSVNITKEKTTAVPRLFTKPMHRKPKSAVMNAPVKQSTENSSLSEDAETASGNNMKIKPQKSKSDNSLETNKDYSELKGKKKSKSDSLSTQGPDLKSNNNSQDTKEQEIAPANIATRPAKIIRQKPKKKEKSSEHPQAINEAKLDVIFGKQLDRNKITLGYQKDPVASSAQGMPRSRNKPKSTIVRKAIAEAEELILGPSSEYIFTKFSDQEEAKAKLAKLDEKFRLQKARVESAVIRNQRNLLPDGETEVTEGTELSDSDISLTKEESKGSVRILPSNFNGVR